MTDKRTKEVLREEWPEGAVTCWRHSGGAKHWITIDGQYKHDRMTNTGNDRPSGRSALSLRLADIAEERDQLRKQIRRARHLLNLGHHREAWNGLYLPKEGGEDGV